MSRTNRWAGQTKQAFDPLQNDRKRELLRALLQMGIAGAGLGAGARGAMGLHQLMTAAKPDVARTSSIPETVPVPVLKPQEDEIDGEPSLAKLAAALANEKAADVTGAVANAIPQPAVDAMPNINVSGHPFQSWYGMPAALAAGGAGIAGGWSLMDWLAKHRRKSQQGQDVDDARNEFRESLANEYRAAMAAKQADSPLDQAFDRWQYAKQAEPKPASGGVGQQLLDWGNLAGGGYLATALGLGTASAYATYKATKARSARRMLQKAVDLRARQRAAPQPIYAVPTSDLADV